MTDLSGRKRADELDADLDLVDLNGDGHYVPFRADVHPSGWVILRTSGGVRPVTPFSRIRFITKNHAHDLMEDARW